MKLRSLLNASSLLFCFVISFPMLSIADDMVLGDQNTNYSTLLENRSDEINLKRDKVREVTDLCTLRIQERYSKEASRAEDGYSERTLSIEDTLRIIERRQSTVVDRSERRRSNTIDRWKACRNELMGASG